jgi:glucose/arabinose dehydrogenase
VLQVAQPFANHNGGQLVFGPDRRLYVGLGDGGGDPDGNGQSPGTLLGKILRIDPRPGGGHPYRIPAGNPLADRAGARPEIWDYGLRNPWWFSFDPATGELWIGDVGQNLWEEVDHEPAEHPDDNQVEQTKWPAVNEAVTRGNVIGWHRAQGRLTATTAALSR